MGQFYKGTEATFLDDAMFKLPYEQMQTALKAKDTAIGDTIQAAIKLGDFDIAHHAIDREDAARLKQEWETKTQNLVDQVLVDPMNYKRVQGDIMSMSRDLNKDMQFGDISTLGKRKAQIEDYQKSIEELYKKDPEKYAHQSALFANELANTKKYKDPETGEYNYFSGQDLYAAPPLTGVVADIFKDATGKEFESLRVDENGQWKVTRGGKEEGWPADRIENLINGHMNANPLLMKGYNQAIGLGALPQDALKTAIEAAKERYKIVQTSYTRKDEAGDVQKLEWAYAFNKEKEEKEQPIINTELVHTNLVNTFNTFKTQVNTTRANLDSRKKALVAQINNYFKGTPLDFKTLSPGAIISKLKKMEAEDPTSFNYSNEIASLEDLAIKNQIATSAKTNYENYRKTKKWADTPEAFREWHKEFTKSNPGNKAFNVVTGEATYQGYGMGKEEVKAVQNTAFEKRLIMPFKIGKDFSLERKMSVGGKEMDVIVQFPAGDQDPMYRELKRTYDAKKLKIKPGVNFLTVKGKVYAVDTRLMNKGGEAVWRDIEKLGHIKIDGTTQVISTTATGATNVDASVTTEKPSYLDAKPGSVITFEPSTYVPVKGVNSQNRNEMQYTIRVGNQPMVLKYDTKANNVVTSPKINEYNEKNAPSDKATKYYNQFGGTGNLDGKVTTEVGTIEVKNGVITYKESNKGGVQTMTKENKNYSEFMNLYIREKSLQEQ